MLHRTGGHMKMSPSYSLPRELRNKPCPPPHQVQRELPKPDGTAFIYELQRVANGAAPGLKYMLNKYLMN